MNFDQQLKQDLARLGRSMSPRDDFAGRVMRQIEMQPTQFSRSIRWWIPIGTSLAASVVLAVGWVATRNRSGYEQTDIQQIDRSQLIRTSSRWQAVSERPVTLGGELPAREISRQLYERVIWTDPQRHATFERMVPREKATIVVPDNY